MMITGMMTTDIMIMEVTRMEMIAASMTTMMTMNSMSSSTMQVELQKSGFIKFWKVAFTFVNIIFVFDEFSAMIAMEIIMTIMAMIINII